MKLTTPLVASIGALLLVGAIFLSLFLSTTAYSPEEVEIPSGPTAPPESQEIAGKNLELVGGVEIDETNIQRVIASLERAESYSAKIVSRLYHGQDSSALACRQTVKNGAYRVDWLNAAGAVERTELLYEDAYYAWRSNTDTYFQGARGDFTTDQSAMLPTYETVCDLPAEQITGGALVQEHGALYLTADTKEDEYVGVYKISVETGMLCAASFSQDGMMTRTVEVSIMEGEPADAMFVLPGESAPVYEEEN